MIAGDVIDAQRCRLSRRDQVTPWLGQLFKVGGDAIVKIAGHKDYVRLKREKFVHHATYEANVSHMSQM